VEVERQGRTGKVVYDGRPYDVMEERWQVWNVPLQAFVDDNDVNLANIQRITLGFGDGGEQGTNGIVYIDDIVRLKGRMEDEVEIVDPYAGEPVYLTEDPFVFGYDKYPLFLDPNCPLMNAGYGFIDEYPDLLGKASCIYVIPDTNYYFGMPDANRVNIGFHYFDWNFVNAGDGNSLSADLNQDMIVNFGDFAVLAGGWLTTYDISDMSTMADEWLEIGEPNIQLQIYGDGNNGYVEVGASGYTPDTLRVFLLADGQYVGEIFGFWDGDALEVDVSEYGSGEHQIKAVSINSEREVTCSNITSIEFACPLNYCFLLSTYEPNKPLHFSAFNPSAEEVTVNVYADCNNLVWSQTYSGSSILDSIPAEITSQNEIDYVSFNKSGGGSVLKTSDADPKESASSVKALIIFAMPLIDIPFYFDSVWRVQAAFKERGIKYARLSRKNATYAKIKEYARNIKYMYICAHGNYRLRGSKVLRTVVSLYDWPAVSVIRSEFPPSEVPSWCEYLEPQWENTVNTFYSMGFANLEFAYFECCYSGRLTINADNQLVEGQRGRFDTLPPEEMLISDMSVALGMHPEFFETRAYQGWYDKSKSKLIPIPCWPFSHDYEKWTRDMWQRLGAGDTVGEAMGFAMSRQTNNDPNAPLNTFRFKGNGDIVNIRLH
jgi:hypothetical protein